MYNILGENMLAGLSIFGRVRINKKYDILKKPKPEHIEKGAFTSRYQSVNRCHSNIWWRVWCTSAGGEEFPNGLNPALEYYNGVKGEIHKHNSVGIGKIKKWTHEPTVKELGFWNERNIFGLALSGHYCWYTGKITEPQWDVNYYRPGSNDGGTHGLLRFEIIAGMFWSKGAQRLSAIIRGGERRRKIIPGLWPGNEHALNGRSSAFFAGDPWWDFVQWCE